MKKKTALEKKPKSPLVPHVVLHALDVKDGMAHVQIGATCGRDYSSANFNVGLWVGLQPGETPEQALERVLLTEVGFMEEKFEAVVGGLFEYITSVKSALAKRR